MSFPTTIPSTGSAATTQTLSEAGHTALHNDDRDNIRALAQKVGTGASTPSSGTFLAGNGVGTSTYRAVVVADLADFDTEVSSNASVAANTAKTTNATHTGDVTGSTALTIADNAVDPAKWTNPYCFSAYESVSTTLIDATNTKLGFDTEEYDYNNDFASGTYTVPINGVYHFSGSIQVGTVSSGLDIIPYLFVNGGLKRRGTRFAPDTNDGAGISTDLSLSAGDTVDLRCYQNSSGNISTSTGDDKTYFAGHLVSPQ